MGTKRTLTRKKRGRGYASIYINEFKDRTLVGIMGEYANMCTNHIRAEESFIDAAFSWSGSPSGVSFWGRVDTLYRRSLRRLNSMEDEAGH